MTGIGRQLPLLYQLGERQLSRRLGPKPAGRLSASVSHKVALYESLLGVQCGHTAHDLPH